MIVVDSSAIVAIRMEEPHWELLVDRLSQESVSDRYLSAATFLEAGTVIAGRLSDPLDAADAMDDFMAKHGLELVTIDEKQIRLALDARIRFGKGFGHSAGLNFGDCFSYALAKVLNASLLYVGGDFDRTDVRSALPKRKKNK